MSDISDRALVVLDQARAMTITSEAVAGGATAFLSTVVKPLRAQIDATFDPLIASAHAQHKAILAEKKRHEGPLIQAEKLIRDGLAYYAEACRDATGEVLSIEGAQARTVHRLKVTDLGTLIQAVAAGKFPVSFLAPVEREILDYAKSYGTTVPGCQVYAETVMALDGRAHTKK